MISQDTSTELLSLITINYIILSRGKVRIRLNLSCHFTDIATIILPCLTTETNIIIRIRSYIIRIEITRTLIRGIISIALTDESVVFLRNNLFYPNLRYSFLMLNTLVHGNLTRPAHIHFEPKLLCMSVFSKLIT